MFSAQVLFVFVVLYEFWALELDSQYIVQPIRFVHLCQPEKYVRFLL